MNKEFRITIPGFKGIYEIDQDGNVYSLWKRKKKKGEDNIGEKRRKLRPWEKKYKDGLVKHCITLYHPDKRKYHFSMNKLVYGSFINGELKHRKSDASLYPKDGNHLNYSLDNIGVRTFSEAKIKFWEEKKRSVRSALLDSKS